MAAVAVLALGQAAGGTFVNEFGVPGSDSQQAVDVARAHFPDVGSTGADVVIHVDTGTLRDGATAAALTTMVDDMRAQPDVTSVGNPLLAPTAPGGGGLLTADGRTATTTVQYGKELSELTAQAVGRLHEAADQARAAGIDVEFRGPVVDLGTEPKTSAAELIGVFAA
ncbi:MAG: MMPL family transporter, partial [Stackebrandtia sp.]